MTSRIDNDWRHIGAFAALLGDPSPVAVAPYAQVSTAEATTLLAEAADNGVIVDGRIDRAAAARLLAELGTSTTAHVHARIARRMLIHGWTDLDVVVRHVRSAASLAPIPDLIDQLDHAARVALTLSDYSGAQTLLGLAEEFSTSDDLDQRVWRMCRLAEAYDGLGRVEDSRRAAGKAFDLAEIAKDVDACLEASVLSVFPADWHAGDFRSAAMIQRLDDLGPRPDQMVALRAAQAIAMMRIPIFEHDGQQVAWVTRAPVAQPLAEEAVSHAVGVGAADRLLALLAWRTCHRAPQFLERRRAYSIEALEISQRLNLPARQVEAASLLAVDAIESHDVGLYENALSVARWVAERDGNPRLLAHTRAMEAGAAFRAGDIEAGRDLRAAAIELARTVDLSSTYSLDQVLLAESLIVGDEPPPEVVMPTDDDPILHHPLAQAVTAVGWARLGEHERAADLLARSLRGLDEESSYLLHLSVAAEAAAEIGDPSVADFLITTLEPWADHIAVDGHAWWPDRPVTAALAELCAVTGDSQRARDFADQALSLAEAIDDPRSTRRMRLVLQRISPNTHHQVTEDLSHELGLTPRQRDVLDLVATGATNREIAHRLAFSVSTIKAEIAAIMRTLGLENRTQIAAYVSQQMPLHPTDDRAG